MSATIKSKLIPNLAQGISQQSPLQRRDSQCEEQYDCINTVEDGATSRHGFDLRMVAAGEDLSDAFFYEFARSGEEHYLAYVIGGSVKVINLNTFAVSSPAISPAVATYLGVPPGSVERDSFVAQTVEDSTFLANKTVKPAFKPATSSTRPKEALIFFKAGAYLCTYSVAVTFGGTVYKFSYKTPDNSVAGNAEYTNTTQLAATFYRAMTGVAAVQNAYGVGSYFAGDVGGSGGGTASVVTTSGSALTSQGFNVSINGNILRIWRDDGQDFKVDSADGQGDTLLLSFKDSVRALSELPKNGFEGMTFAVRSAGTQDNGSEYYVEFTQDAATGGFWRERTKQGILYSLEPTTMPHILKNVGVDSFTLLSTVWSDRIAGDGTLSAKNPGFIGRRLEDIFWHKNRLAFLTEATVDWSKARNPYTFFPDTVQTILADAPIGAEFAASGTTALLRKALMLDEGLIVWSQGSQFRVHSGSDPFRQDTVQPDPSTSFEFAEKSTFGLVGKNLYFAAEPGAWANIRMIPFQNGKPSGELYVTDHTPKLIPKGVRRVNSSDSGRMLTVQTDGSDNRLYLYNYYDAGTERVQSSWNIWRLPAGKILWSTIYRKTAYVAMDRDGDFVILSSPLTMDDVDPGGTYRTRYDMRVDETQCTLSYNPTTEQTTVTLPYSLLSGDNPVKVALRASGTDPAHPYFRGRVFEAVSSSGNQVVVKRDLTGYPFYVGLVVSSEREESPFYLRGKDGPVPYDSMTISQFSVGHDKSGYYRIEVTSTAGRMSSVELKPISMGIGENVLSEEPRLDTGFLVSPVQQDPLKVRIRIINDSHLPSRWQTAEYRYSATMRATPSGN